MKKYALTVCLLATLTGAARAESVPVSEAPAVPPPPAAPPVPPSPPAAAEPSLEARYKEARYKAEVRALEEEVRQIDPEGRLTPDQIFRLLQDRDYRRAEGHFDPTPVAVSFSLFSCLLTGYLAWLLANYRKARQLHETVRLMVEKGAEIPQALLAPPPARKPSDLRRGVILSTSGLGLAIFLAVLPDADGAWGVGVTLFFIGVGHLIVWRLQRVKGALSDALASEPQP